jgi:hypothetical protein
MCKVKLKYDNPHFKEIYDYSDTSESGLISKISGEKVGFIHHNRITNVKTWRIKFKEKSYVISRLIWYILQGSIPVDRVVDHKDGNPLNNKITNLRLTTQLVNNKNHAKQVNNKSGVTGVYKEEGRWRVCWSEDGAKRTKSFSIAKYGKEAFNLAVAFRSDKISEIGEYTERHGKDGFPN